MQAPVADKYIVPTEAPVALDMADVNSSTIKITLKAGHVNLRPAPGVDGKSPWKKLASQNADVPFLDAMQIFHNIVWTKSRYPVAVSEIATQVLGDLCMTFALAVDSSIDNKTWQQSKVAVEPPKGKSKARRISSGLQICHVGNSGTKPKPAKRIGDSCIFFSHPSCSRLGAVNWLLDQRICLC